MVVHLNMYITQINLFFVKLLYDFSYLYWTVTTTCLTNLIICSTITADYAITFTITRVLIYTSYGPLTRVIPSICVT